MGSSLVEVQPYSVASQNYCESRLSVQDCVTSEFLIEKMKTIVSAGKKRKIILFYFAYDPAKETPRIVHVL